MTFRRVTPRPSEEYAMNRPRTSRNTWFALSPLPAALLQALAPPVAARSLAPTSGRVGVGRRSGGGGATATVTHQKRIF